MNKKEISIMLFPLNRVLIRYKHLVDVPVLACECKLHRRNDRYILSSKDWGYVSTDGKSTNHKLKMKFGVVDGTEEFVAKAIARTIVEVVNASVARGYTLNMVKFEITGQPWYSVKVVKTDRGLNIDLRKGLRGGISDVVFDTLY